jgi:hypothetical protein
LIENRRITAEAILKEAMTENHDTPGFRRLVFLGQERAAHRWCYAYQWEEVGSYDRALQPHWFTAPGHDVVAAAID